MLKFHIKGTPFFSFEQIDKYASMKTGTDKDFKLNNGFITCVTPLIVWKLNYRQAHDCVHFIHIKIIRREKNRLQDFFSVLMHISVNQVTEVKIFDFHISLHHSR